MYVNPVKIAKKNSLNSPCAYASYTTCNAYLSKAVYIDTAPPEIPCVTASVIYMLFLCFI